MMVFPVDVNTTDDELEKSRIFFNALIDPSTRIFWLSLRQIREAIIYATASGWKSKGT